jgi:CheY-like chemotaxis protein
MKGTRRLKVLLADDDEDDRVLFSDAIDSLNLNIDLILASDGRELVEYLKAPENPQPEMIFLDLNMPFLSGLDCLPIIRGIEGLGSVPIAIYSTSSARKDMEDALSLGANIYIQKPNDFIKLKEIIKKIVDINWQYIRSDFDSDIFVMSL